MEEDNGNGNGNLLKLAQANSTTRRAVIQKRREGDPFQVIDGLLHGLGAGAGSQSLAEGCIEVAKL